VRPGDDVRDGWNVLRGTVLVAAFLGVSIQYLIRAPGGEELTVIAPNRDGTPPDVFTVGREVLLTWNPDFTFVVDKEASP
jgi:spermidine/putrescine transport system ATP-binding protein